MIARGIRPGSWWVLMSPTREGNGKRPWATMFVWMENLYKLQRNWVTWRGRREAFYIASVLYLISE